jgi:glycosyltransferase involved in cell wall biosynthesis
VTVTGRPRGLFVGEHSLGNRTILENIRAAAAGGPLRVEGVHDAARGMYLRAPLPGTVRSLLTLRRDVHALLAEAPADYLVTNTHKPVALCHDLVARVPTAIMLDATPDQFDEQGFLDDPTDRMPVVPHVKRRIVRSLFRRAAAMLPRSEWAARSLVDDYGVDPERVHVVPSPVDTAAWSPKEKPRRELPEIVFVGGVFAWKGGPELLEWFRRAGRGRAHLTIVTRSDVREEPGVRVVRAETNSTVLRDLVRTADLFVLPTRAECYSVAVQEAMASGVPVVTSDIGGMRDVVEDGVSGYLLPPGDGAALDAPLDALLGDPERRGRMGEAGRARAVERFDSGRIVERITAIGEAIAAGWGRA